MNSIFESIEQARRVSYKNNFLRDVSFMFTVESSVVFDPQFSNLSQFLKTYELKSRIIGADGSSALLASKDGIDVLITSRLLIIRVEAEKYKSFENTKDFILSFIKDYANEVSADTISTLVISKRNSFSLKRENEVLKEMSIDIFLQSLFSKSFLDEYHNKEVFKSSRSIIVSARYDVLSSESEMNVEFAVSSFDYDDHKIQDLDEKLTNANNAVFDMWSYTMSDNAKQLLMKE